MSFQETNTKNDEDFLAMQKAEKVPCDQSFCPGLGFQKKTFILASN